MSLRGEVFQCIRAGLPCAGLGLLAAFNAHFIKQDLADLFGGTHLELAACLRVGIGFIFRHALGKVRGETREHVAVDLDAFAFHAGDNRNERTLQSFVDGGDAAYGQFALEHMPEA